MKVIHDPKFQISQPFNIAPLFVHCNLWQYIDEGSKSKYCHFYKLIKFT